MPVCLMWRFTKSQYPGLNSVWRAHFFMDDITDLNVLYNAFLASMKSSAWKEEPQRFEVDFLSEIVKLKHEIASRTYKTLPGIEFTLRERGKVRHIHGSRMRDRVVRHAFCDGELTEVLQPFLIWNNGACQKGKGLSFARKMFERDLHNYWLEYRTNEGYIGFVDFSRFYDNIRHDKIRSGIMPKLSENGKWLLDENLRHFRIDVSYMDDDEYAECLNKKFDSLKYYNEIPFSARTGEKYMPKGVDIGDQISQNIGVFFPTPIDNYVKIVRGCRYYGRYSDDMYVICRDREELKSVIAGIREKSAELGLFLNERKTHIARLGETFRFLQTKYFLTADGKVVKRINPKNITREKRKLRSYKRLLSAGRMKYEDIEQSAKSWMGNYYRLMSKKQVRHMKEHYRDLFGKELQWK